MMNLLDTNPNGDKGEIDYSGTLLTNNKTNIILSCSSIGVVERSCGEVFHIRSIIIIIEYTVMVLKKLKSNL